MPVADVPYGRPFREVAANLIETRLSRVPAKHETRLCSLGIWHLDHAGHPHRPPGTVAKQDAPSFDRGRPVRELGHLHPRATAQVDSHLCTLPIHAVTTPIDWYGASGCGVNT